jgi:eukaryotic-like serine/threonine-protein kinase
VSPATDLYALGSVLYELLTGRPPYRFESLVELAVKQRESPVTPIRELAPEVPPDVEAAVMRCLEPDPGARPSSAAALARDLGDSSTEPQTEPLPQPTAVLRGRRRSLMPRRADRRLWLALAAAAAVIAIVAGLALASRDDGGGEPPASSEVQQVDPGSSPADRARNLADWLRENSE